MAAARNPSCPPRDFRFRERLFQLGVFPAGSIEHMPHVDRFARFRSQKGRVYRDISNVASGHIESSQLRFIQPFSRRRARECPSPNLGPLLRVRKGELHDESDAP